MVKTKMALFKKGEKEKVAQPAQPAQPEPQPVVQPVVKGDDWVVDEVAVQTEPVLVNQKTGETLQQIQIFQRILNDLEELKRRTE